MLEAGNCKLTIGYKDMKERNHQSWSLVDRLLLGTRRAVCALLLATLSTLAWADEDPPDLSYLSLEELTDLNIESVYGASKYRQKTTEAPASVTIITADQIQKYGYRTLAEVLRSVRGFYVTNDRNYSFVGVRGFARPGDYNSRILLLVDGHRINEIIFGHALLGTEFPMDVDLIDRVEIIRGPSSSLYGTNAIFAVINVISKKGRNVNGVNVTGEVGSFATRQGRVTYGNNFQNGMEMLVSSSFYGSQGQRNLFFEEFNDPTTNNGVAENGDGDQFVNTFAKFSFQHFTLQGLYGSREKAFPTASFGTVFNDPRNKTIEKRGYIELLYERNLGSQWDVASRVYYDDYAYDGDYVYDSGNPFFTETTVNKDLARGGWWGAELRFTKKLEEKHTLTYGAEYRNNFRQDQFNFDEDPFFQFLDDQRSSQNLAIYLQDEVAVHKTLLFNIGVRHDHYETFGGTTNPRVAMIFNPRKKTTLKLVYGRAFRAPTPYELYWRQPGATKSNPLLSPETTNTTELVLEQFLGKRYRVTATNFHYKINGLITQQTDPADGLLVYNNLGKVVGKGMEFEVSGKWPNGLEGGIAYTFQNSRNLEMGAALRNSPKHLAQYNMMAPLFNKKTFAGINVLYMSKRRTGAGNFTDGFFVTNLTLFRKELRKGFVFSSGIYNLFNKRYGDPGSEEHVQDIIQQDGRSFRFKVTYRFANE